MELLALDIETDGLEASNARVLAVGLVTSGWDRVISDVDERKLLSTLEKAIRSKDDCAFLITWNGEEFDLPFLRARFEVHGIATKLDLTPTGKVGKYGRERFKAKWSHLDHVDLAPLYESFSKELAIKWSLKPIARRVLGYEPIEVDRRAEAIASMNAIDLKEYVLSDARITHQLGRRLLMTESDLAPMLG